MNGKPGLAITLLTVLASVQCPVVAEESFRTYLSQHDIIYQQPPLHPRDGFPIGNRTMAGMVYQEQGHYKVQLVKDDVWDHRSVPQEEITAGYDHRRVLELLSKGETETLNNLPGTRFTDKWTGVHKKSSAWTPYPAPKIAGWLTVEAGGDEFLEQRLCLSEASVKTNYRHVELKAWVAATDNIFVLEIDPKKRLPLTLSFERPACDVMGTVPVFEKQANGITMTYPFPDGFTYIAALRLIGADAEIEFTDSGAKFKLDTADSVKLIVSVVSSFDRDDHLSGARQKVKGIDDQQLHRLELDHQQQWDDYWAKSRIQLSDKFVENVWYFNVYQMGASYSPKFSGGLAGPFFGEEPPPWQNDLHEVNESFRYYSVHAANHPELGDGFVETYWRMIPVVRNFTKQFYGFASLRRMSFKKGVKECDNLAEKNAAAPIFQDICAGAVGVVNDMLLQSQSGSIHVFPALPEDVDATFEQLRARGAFLVSSARRQGTVQFVEVQAETDGVMKLDNPWPNENVVCSDPHTKKAYGQKMFEVPMTAGQRIAFHVDGTKPLRTVWNGRPATAPRSVVRVIQEKMPAGHRNDPLAEKPLVKYADQCTIWLGRPKATIPKEER